MKKYTIIVSVIVVIIGLPGPVKAAEVDLWINQQPVNQQLKVVEGRTLLPAQVISDHLGGHLEWHPEEQRLKVIVNQFPINFHLGSRVAVVNSQVIPLTIAPCILEGQVFIPLRSLKKIYGGYLTWKPEQKTIYYQSNRVNRVKTTARKWGVEVIISPRFLSDYEVDLLHQPQRLVVDLMGVNRANINRLLQVDSQIIKRIRVSQFKFDPAVVRVVVDLRKFSSYQVDKRGNDLALQIKAKPGIVTSSIRNRNPTKKNQSPKIVIDPGHGGKDPGAIGISGSKEKQVNLQIAKQTAKLLRQAGYSVLLTRKQDKFISLSRRAQLANQWAADVFISIHANFNYKPQINGTATYAHWHSSKKNWGLAWYVQSEVVNNLQLKNNGLKAANFVVLRKTDMPAILLETAFLSNPREERLLANKSFRAKAARGIVAGMNKYFTNRSSI